MNKDGFPLRKNEEILSGTFRQDFKKKFYCNQVFSKKYSLPELFVAKDTTNKFIQAVFLTENNISVSDFSFYRRTHGRSCKHSLSNR